VCGGVDDTHLTIKMLIHITALVVTEQRCFAGHKTKQPSTDSDNAGARSSESEKETMTFITKSVVSGIVTRIDLLEYISKGLEE
jgi:hypothetical protein